MQSKHGQNQRRYNRVRFNQQGYNNLSPKISTAVEFPNLILET